MHIKILIYHMYIHTESLLFRQEWRWLNLIHRNIGNSPHMIFQVSLRFAMFLETFFHKHTHTCPSPSSLLSIFKLFSPIHLPFFDSFLPTPFPHSRLCFSLLYHVHDFHSAISRLAYHLRVFWIRMVQRIGMDRASGQWQQLTVMHVYKLTLQTNGMAIWPIFFLPSFHLWQCMYRGIRMIYWHKDAILPCQWAWISAQNYAHQELCISCVY